jgi:hypothetical protein
VLAGGAQHAELLCMLRQAPSLRHDNTCSSYLSSMVNGLHTNPSPAACTTWSGPLCQPAVLAALHPVLPVQDSLITSYRDHCHHITRGGTVAEVMAELFGRATGATKGGWG